jgi:predicted RNA-binding protein with PIN domain
VDGYNVLHADPTLAGMLRSNLEHARDQLIDRMAEYQAVSGTRLVVVFDSHSAPGSRERREQVRGLEIVFSGVGRSADEVIERLIRDVPDRSALTVATSDRLERALVQGMGVACWSAQELISAMREHQADSKERQQGLGSAAGAPVEDRLDPEVRARLERWRRGEPERGGEL